MLFYKVDITLENTQEDPKRSERDERARAYQPIIDTFYENQKRSCHIALVDIQYKRNRASLCAVSQKKKLSDEVVEGFLALAEMDYTSYNYQEITMEAYCSLLRTSSRNDFIQDDDDVTEALRIDRLKRRIDHTETVIPEESTQQQLLEQSARLLCDTSLSGEIRRIYQGKNIGRFAGHPVHYLLQSNDGDTLERMSEILTQALYQNERIISRRLCLVQVDEDETLEEEGLKQLYDACYGATVVVSFVGEDQDAGAYATGHMEAMGRLCAQMRRCRNAVLTVICLPKTSPHWKDAILENLGTMTVVPIQDEPAFGDRAKKYLKALAKEQGVRGDKALYGPITADKGHTVADLNLLFHEWYDRYLKTKVYTQYAGLEAANKQAALQKPKGRAIDELSQMIGLTEAKAVIQQALDFYKARKLFAQKGFSAQHPTLHMCFTGNPGTAKTTVARLFAQILKDNQLLSVGNLYEVGRADLVGKYVGWTAQLVKQKFKAAKGSVLFIDEAYSLVEKDGLYGDEAIHTIVQEMENHREDMVVIFAGYPDKMEGFLQKNPGLRSRIAFHVPFADYNAGELFQITQLLAEKQKLCLAEDVQGKLLPLFEAALQQEDFGNGRFARNLVEKATLRQASRLVAMDVDCVGKSDVELLLAEDFDTPLPVPPEKRCIGF